MGPVAVEEATKAERFSRRQTANWTAEPPSRLVIRLQVGPPGTILRLIYAVSGDQLIVERAAQRADRTVVLAPVRYSRTQSG